MTPSIAEGRFAAGDGTPIFYRALEPATVRARILIVHGYAEHSGRYTHVMEHLAARGYACYAPDHRGHGLTSELLGYVPSFPRVEQDLLELKQVVDAKGGKAPWFILGHSMGACVSVNFLAAHQELFMGAVLSAPMVMVPENVSPVLLALSGMLSALLPKAQVQKFNPTVISRDPAVIERTRKDPLYYWGNVMARTGYGLVTSMKRAEKNCQALTLPVLVMQGDQDKTIPVTSAEFAFTRVSSRDKTLKIWAGLYHEIMNEPEKDQVFAVMDAWLDAHTG